MEGWIKLHRKMLENPAICKDAEYFAVWCYLLLNATHKEIKAEFNGRTITLEPGQLITGRKSIARYLRINESKVQRTLKRFESEHQIEQQTTSQNRLVTVNNWNYYQETEQGTEQRLNNERTTTEQRANTNKNEKNGNNVKNDKKESEPQSLTNLPDSELGDFKDIWLDYLEHRKELGLKRYKSAKSERIKFKDLLRLSNESASRAQEIVNQSRGNSWQGLFPIKDKPETQQETAPAPRTNKKPEPKSLR